jgi:K+-transporting ATPase ATPase C chain
MNAREGVNVGTERASLVRELRTAGLALVVFTLLTGAAYPLVITAAAQLLFRHQANGSLIMHGGKAVGSELIGQPFEDPRYFCGRPSATTLFPYNAASSSGSNLAVSSPAQREAIRARIARLRAVDPGNTLPIPLDLVTASGSGLDPHISVAAAEWQAVRVARARSLSQEAVRTLVHKHTLARQLGLLGGPRVNVLELNLALDELDGD